MNLKKFSVKGLPRYARLRFDRDTSTIRLLTGISEKSAVEVWSKVLPANKIRKMSFKIPQAPGMMFRVLSGKIYIREEIL